MKSKSKIYSETVDKIADNAKAAQKVWKNFSQDPKLRDNFHLRPTTGGITIVSTLPHAPMRGVDVSIDQLDKRLKSISNQMDALLSVNKKTVTDNLNKLGFKIKKSEVFREENVQAMFIQGMVLGQEIYEGIDFVASELNLNVENRFDIVGIKDNTLYIFELKKGRTLRCVKQTANYVKLVKDNEAAFKKVLSDYPHNPVSAFENVRGIAVMRYAANATEKLIKSANEKGVGLWYYEQAITFRSKTYR